MKMMPLCYFAAIINLRIGNLLFPHIILIINTQYLNAKYNPISGYSRFQIITDANFTEAGNAHIHGFKDAEKK